MIVMAMPLRWCTSGMMMIELLCLRPHHGGPGLPGPAIDTLNSTTSCLRYASAAAAAQLWSSAPHCTRRLQFQLECLQILNLSAPFLPPLLPVCRPTASRWMGLVTPSTPVSAHEAKPCLVTVLCTPSKTISQTPPPLA